MEEVEDDEMMEALSPGIVFTTLHFIQKLRMGLIS
jgi:hypothetical protein